MKKMQVFISSTYTDLVEERQNAVKIILCSGHIPAGMELFGQDDREQWEVIKEWIDASDVFLIMVKNRYGSICSETKKSYTQMEYEYALQKNKPIIKLVINDFINKDECDDYPALQHFRDEIRNGGTDSTIHDEVEFTHRITTMLQYYENEVKSGLCRYDEIKKLREKEKLLYFLMFADDKKSEGFNRFNVGPKIMMLLDKTQKINKVEITRLDISYLIKSDKEECNNIFDCERYWAMSNIRNISKKKLKTYYFYTTTDIGERENANVKLTQCVQEREFALDEVVRNNGISCWEWEIEPNINCQEMINDIEIKEIVKDAWNFNRNWEIAYFIPKCFGESISSVNFKFETERNVPILEMNLYEVKVVDDEIKRELVGRLSRTSCEDGRHIYGIGLDGHGNEINMESFYYIKLNVVK